MIDLSISADQSFKPTLFNVHKLLDEFIVGEHESRMCVFTNWVLGNQHVNLTGQRSSGKTYVASNVAKILPSKHGAYSLTGGSDKATYYDAEKIKAHTHFIIPELNKLNKETKEMLKSWGEGETAEYKTVIWEGGCRRVQCYRIPSKAFIFCLADEEEMKIDDQLRSRLTVIRMDCTELQNISVLQQQAELAMVLSNPKTIDKKAVDELKLHIGTLPPWNVNGFKHPAAPSFIQCIPKIFTDCRRDFPKYLRNTYGITRFYWKERMSIDFMDSKVFFVTPQDMYYNHIIYGDTLVESSLRCSAMERQLIDILKDTDGLERTVIQQRVRGLGLNISNRMITNMMRNLADLGYAEIIKVGTSPAAYKQGALFKNFAFNIDWKEVVQTCKDNMKKHYPAIADEYIERYCNKPLVTHPFVGTEINLLDIEPEVKKIRKSEGFGEFTKNNEPIGIDDIDDVEEEVIEDE